MQDTFETMPFASAFNILCIYSIFIRSVYLTRIYRKFREGKCICTKLEKQYACTGNLVKYAYKQLKLFGKKFWNCIFLSHEQTNLLLFQIRQVVSCLAYAGYDFYEFHLDLSPFYIEGDNFSVHNICIFYVDSPSINRSPNLVWVQNCVDGSWL